MDRMINYIKLTGMLRTYKTYNSTIEFSKYEFNNKCMYVCLCEYIYIYIYIERERERELGSSYTWYNFKQCYTAQYF